MPEEIAYEPGVPEYVPRQGQFYEKSKKADGLIALIYETKGDYANWLGKFNSYCPEKKTDFGWGVAGEIRRKCR